MLDKIYVFILFLICMDMTNNTSSKMLGNEVGTGTIEPRWPSASRTRIATALLALSLVSGVNAGAQTPTKDSNEKLVTISSPSATLQVTKWQGYWRMASNGEDFEKLALLSSEEMGKLPFAIRIEVKKWKQTREDEKVVSLGRWNEQKKETVVSIDRWNDQKKETVVSKLEESKRLDETMASQQEELDWLDAQLATLKKEWADLDAANNEIRSKVETTWNTLTVQLQKLDSQKQRDILMKDPLGNKKILDYVIANNLPPPELAKKLISLIIA